jgi:hypothetical protein
MNAPANRTRSLAAAAVVDADGVKTTTATVTTAATHTAADMNGALVTSGVFATPRSLTVTLSSQAGAYTTDAWTFTGKRGGADVSVTSAPTGTDGNETLRPGQLFDSLTSIEIPAQSLTSGSYTIGVGDIGAQFGDRFIGVKAHAASAVTVAYDEAGTIVDTLPSATTREDIRPVRIATNGLTVGVTLYE